MKKLLISASLVALAFPATAQAQAYIGVSGGVVSNENLENEGDFAGSVPANGALPAIPSGTEYQFETNTDLGWTAGAQIGYAFDNGFRLELDGNYQSTQIDFHEGLTIGGTNIDGLDYGQAFRRTTNPTNSTVGEFLADGDGDVETYGVFLNALYDFDLGGVAPYLGVGGGIMVTDLDYKPDGLRLVNDADPVWAYQGIAGISGDLSDNVQLFAEYKYRRMFDEPDFIVTGPLPIDGLSTEFAQHSAVLGLRFLMGGEEAAPPPPPQIGRAHV